MKQGNMSKKLILILSLVGMLAVAAVVGLILKSNQVKPNTVVKEKNETFQFYKSELQKLSNAEDTGVMIMDCDDESDFASITNATVTHKTGKYVQGTGALRLGSIVSRGGTREAYVKFDDVDISEYKSGSIHFSIYVSDIEKMSDEKFNVEITSSGTWDMEEMSWWISPTILDSGWNDVYLSIADATVNKAKGEPDFENINFCRILAGGGKSGLEFAIDNVYATNTKGDALEDAGKLRRASSKGRYFMDCDTLDGLSIEDSANYSTLVITSAKGEYKEGKGALGVMSPKGTWVEAKLKPFDLSAYQDGVLSFWLYVDDVSYINKGKFVLELTSSGTFDKNELTWVYDGAALKNGWNEIVFSIARGGKGSEDPIDLTKVNFMRIYGSKCEKGLNLILDGFQVRDADVVKPKDGVLLSCDNLDRISAKSNNTFSITTTAGEYKEGTGAFKSVGSDAEFFRVGFYEKYDLTEYEEGALHLWLYVDDVSKLGDILSLELGSGGKPDVDEYQWQIQQAELENGWNELTLEFGRALKLGGTVDLGKINCMRLFAAKCKSQVTVIMDDVRVVQIEKQVITPQDGMLLNCDSLNRVTVSSDGTFSIVKTAGQFVEGTGAYRCAGTDDRLFQITFRDYYDLSAYKDGGIEMQLWIDDVSKLGSVLSVELGSGGKPDVNEYQWQVNTAGLKNGWNTLSLRFSRAMQMGGTPDISRINAMRIFSAKCTGEITALLDNVRAVNFESKTNVPENGLFLSCDNMNDLTISSKGELTVTNVGGEFKEGTGAYKVVGAADTFFQMTFDNKYDISAYKYGGLHLWLYVDDTTKLGKWLVVELGSGGKSDVNEYQWALEPAILTSGWNEILLRFDNATEVAGGADLKAIDVMRIYSANSKGVTAILDDVRAVVPEKGPGEDDYSTVTDPLDICDFIVDVESGKEITVLQITDTQITNDDMEIRCFNSLRETVAATNPDLILLTGDLVQGKDDDDGSQFLALLDEMEKFGIPWAPIFGNHDGESELGLDWMCEQFEQAEHCLFKQRELTGNGNYIVGITQDNILKRVFFMLDSNGCVGMSTESKANGHWKTTQGFARDQITWYSEAAEKLTELSSTTKISFVFHIPIKIFEKAYEQYGYDSTDVVDTRILNSPIDIDSLDNAKDGDFGYLAYSLARAWDTDYTVWNGLKNLGVDSILVGHEHCNSASVVYEGVRFQFGQKTGAYDKINYLKPDGTFEISWYTTKRIPITGGTVLTLADDGSIKDGNIYLSGDVKYDELDTVAEGMIVSGNTRKGMEVISPEGNYISITTAEGESQEGGRALKSVGSGSTRWKIVLENPVDISEYAAGGIHLWLYVSDASKLSSALTVEINSSGSYDTDEYQWQVRGLETGWNELYLNFASASVRGTPNLSAINFIRLYAGETEEITMILDDMRAVNVEIQPENPVEPQTGWRLDTNIDNLVKADGNENIQGLDEGTTYLKTQTYDETSEDTQKATKLTATSNKLNLDFTGYCMADLKLTFRVYNAGTEGKIAEGGSIRLSNNESNKQYATLLYAANKIKINGNSWTKVEIPLSDAGWSYHNESGQPDTKFDLSAGIHSFSFDNWKCTGEYYICDIQIEEQSPEWNLDSEIVAQKTKNNNQADTFLTATGSESFLETGKTYFKTTDYTESASTWSLKATGLNNPFGDKYSNENLKLTFMVYSASEQTNMTSGGTIRLGNSDCGSSGTWVVKPADISLKQGWNKVELPLKDSDLGWFGFDWSQKIVAVSFDGWKCNDVYYICNIKLVPITTSEWNLDSSLEKKTNVEEYIGTSEDAWTEAGKTYLKTSKYDSANDTATKSTIKTEKLDLDFGTYTLEDLKLTFRVYNPGESTTLATGGSIRLGNTNCGNDGTLWYIVANKISVAPNGWTTVEIPLSEWGNLNVSSTTILFDWSAGIKAFTFDNLKCSDEFYICDIKLVTVD